jgi:hypothetical protein
MMSREHFTFVGDNVHFVGPDGACHAATVLRWAQTADEPTEAVLWLVDSRERRPRPDAPVPIERVDFTGARRPTPGTCHHPARCGRGIEL